MEEYYYTKLLQSICFTQNPYPYIDEELLNPLFLEKLRTLLTKCEQVSIINERMKNNLLEVTNYLRYNGHKDLANELILLINRSKIDYSKWEQYFYDECEMRKSRKKDRINVSNEECVEALFYSLEMDYIVLVSLTCDDETFNEIFEKLTLNEFYFLSCLRMLEEVPELFMNEQSVGRLSALNLYNKSKRGDKDIKDVVGHKRVIKTGKKLIKKLIR